LYCFISSIVFLIAIATDAIGKYATKTSAKTANSVIGGGRCGAVLSQSLGGLLAIHTTAFSIRVYTPNVADCKRL
jgi:hypothetical protein